MPHPQSEPARANARAGTSLRIDDAGGVNRRFIITAEYLPRSGKKKKTVKSNNTRYGKSWATKEEIGDAEKAAFLEWIHAGLARGGGSRQRVHKELGLASRSSDRINQQMTSMCTTVADVVVERGVAQCVKYIIDNVVHRARHGGVSKINYVPSKRHHRTSVLESSAQLLRRPWGEAWVARPKKNAPCRRRLVQRKRQSKGFEYRVGVLSRRRIAKEDEDLEWLQTHEHRLATIIARQDLHELLPDGMTSQKHSDSDVAHRVATHLPLKHW